MSPGLRKESRLAVLIDAENVGARYIKPLFEEVTKFGRTTAKRIYGDWTQPHLAPWRNLLHEYAIIPIQQFRLSSGKNCTDCALIIDAMDLLYSGNFDGFCIVSSDSDFTRLASRLRESGLAVYGFGGGKTPEAFVKSCDQFIILELLEPQSEPTPATQGVAAIQTRMKGAAETSREGGVEAGTQVAGKKSVSPARKAGAPAINGAAPAPRLKQDKIPFALVTAAYLATAGEDGWADLAAFGAQIRALSPSFDLRAFGCSKLGGFVESIDRFEIKKIPSAKSPLSFIWLIKWK